MDRVRFGRALGVGARQAAKTMMSAAAAAAAPNPSAPASSTRQEQAARPQVVARPAAPRIPVPDKATVKNHARNLKQSVWSPLTRFSSVLWLEVTGFFFAIFALIAGQQTWRWRGAGLAPHSPDAMRFYGYLALFLLFGYFTVSSFVRAKRRQRR